jgi:hypothetical protein
VVYLDAVVSDAVGRAIAISLATLATFGLVFLQAATSPSGEGYWKAMAAAPDGGLYVADETHRELRLVKPGSVATRLSSTPAGIYRALAADGPNLLLATEGRLWVSSDTGATWRGVLPGRFTAVSVRGSHELAGAWALGLYVSEDAGTTWSEATVPHGDTEFEALIPGYAATLLGLLTSSDDDRTWTRAPGTPDRVTAVSRQAGGIRIGDWHGDVCLLQASPASRSCSTVPGGVLALAGEVVATTSGLYPDRVGPLHRREVTGLVLSDANYYAAIARGPIYSSTDGTDWRLVYQG